MPFTYDYPRPMVTADVVLVRAGERPEARSQVLLVKRGREPFRGRWALPGGFVEIDEDLSDAARRELLEETGVELASGAPLVQLGAFGAPGRDPRGRTISVAYLARISREGSTPAAGDDAARAAWFPLSKLPELAFDHQDILAAARGRLENEAGSVTPDECGP